MIRRDVEFVIKQVFGIVTVFLEIGFTLVSVDVDAIP
jgi:hypothetical protein